MVKKQKNDDGTIQFVVILDGLNLPEKVVGKIEQEIRRAVFSELANVDNNGDMVISPLGTFKGPGGGGQTEGIQVVGKREEA